MQHKNIIEQALRNTDFRRVLFTNTHSQVVLMSVPAAEEIGTETHNVDQVLVFVQGDGKAVVGGQEYAVSPGDLIDVPAGTEHNFINSGSTDWKLYTVYSPPEHAAGIIHRTKAEADAAELLP